ncbi:MAG TPA: two-component system response regulator [Armatimonadetes bacterium]|jgi:DNA-binding response OmpR family regulator|nr:two-component system response regulator [Armatimonadota bacterium]
MSKRVLVIDDENAILRLVELNLTRAGYEVITASDGDEGLSRARECAPDIIILDIVMPRTDGYRLFAELQADPVLSNVPVVFLTARAQEADLDWGWNSGAAAYITKPFAAPAFVDLIRRMDALMDQGVEVTPAVLRPCRMPNAPQPPRARSLDVGS